MSNTIKITKDEARGYLEKYIINNCYNDSYDEVRLPMKDAIVMRANSINEINHYTFKYLLCIAYDLHE